MSLSSKVCAAVMACAVLSAVSCSEDSQDFLVPDNALTGTVTNKSGVSGVIIVEIEHNLRDKADENGNWKIMVHDDYYVDSLYAWVDVNDDGWYDPGEPYGFYRDPGDENLARPIRVRNTNVGNLNFDIK